MPYHFGPQRCNKFARRNAQKFAFIVAGFQKGWSSPLPLSFNAQFRDIFVFFFQTRTISVVSEETKKQLEQMLDQNKELETILAKTRSDCDAKVGITNAKTTISRIRGKIRPRLNVALFMRRTKLSELSSWKVRRLAQWSSSEWVWIVQYVVFVCFRPIERLKILSGTKSIVTCDELN